MTFFSLLEGSNECLTDRDLFCLLPGRVPLLVGKVFTKEGIMTGRRVQSGQP